MEILIQKCQACGSRDLRNILARTKNQYVYVQCRQCNGLVARYTLDVGGYYHEGKGFESFLRSIERDAAYSSGRNLQYDFENIQEEIRNGFESVLEHLSTKFPNGTP